MADITAIFQNNFGASRKWAIWDVGRDPIAPPQIFNDYLEAGASTPTLASLQDPGGTQGHARYQRSGGPATDVNVSDGDQVGME